MAWLFKIIGHLDCEHAATHKPGTTPAAKKTAAKPGRPPIEQAFAARQLEDGGAYGRAADELKVLRKMVKIDADLELELALDEARSGSSDSALARLSIPMMEAAANDSMPLKRRAEYPYQRETFWVDGKFDGWNWYILRARAELEARRGRWKEATAWARRATDAWVLNGKDWHILDPNGKTSHFVWRDERHVIAFAFHPSHGQRFYLFRD